MTTPAHFVPASQLARSARSDEIVAKHKKYLWPSVTNYFQQPLVADRGEMQQIWDIDGNKYLDFFGGILTVSVGHCHPKVSGKVAAQVNLRGAKLNLNGWYYGFVRDSVIRRFPQYRPHSQVLWGWGAVTAFWGLAGPFWGKGKRRCPARAVSSRMVLLWLIAAMGK